MKTLKYKTIEEIEKHGKNYIAPAGIYGYEGNFIVIEKDFVFKPSFPSFYLRWRKIDKDLLLFASLVHDYGYSKYANRKQADEKFFITLYTNGTPLNTCIEIYITVRLLGWVYWYDINDLFKKS